MSKFLRTSQQFNTTQEAAGSKGQVLCLRTVIIKLLSAKKPDKGLDFHGTSFYLTALLAKSPGSIRSIWIKCLRYRQLASLFLLFPESVCAYSPLVGNSR